VEVPSAVVGMERSRSQRSSQVRTHRG